MPSRGRRGRGGRRGRHGSGTRRRGRGRGRDAADRGRRADRAAHDRRAAHARARRQVREHVTSSRSSARRACRRRRSRARATARGALSAAATSSRSGRTPTSAVAPHPDGFYREYSPGSVLPHELWIVPLPERCGALLRRPVRPHLPVDARRAPPAEAPSVARLVATALPGGCWRELHVLRDLAPCTSSTCTRTTAAGCAGSYTTDTRYTLEERQPTLPPPCAAGDPHASLAGAERRHPATGTTRAT